MLFRSLRDTVSKVGDALGEQQVLMNSFNVKEVQSYISRKDDSADAVFERIDVAYTPFSRQLQQAIRASNKYKEDNEEHHMVRQFYLHLIEYYQLRDEIYLADTAESIRASLDNIF